MIINVNQLNKTNGGRDFSYNDKAETAITNAICYWYELESNGGTKGFNPGYDKKIGNTKVEIKISSTTGLFLEFAKGNDELSGIFASEADIYMTVNPGQDQGENCMKVRVYHKRELEHWVKHMLEKHPEEIKQYSANKLGPGSQGFMLKFKAVEDLYIMGFTYIKDTNGHIIFDTHQPLNVDRDYAKDNIHRFLK